MQVIIFGGCGFTGLHLTKFLFNQNLASKIFIVDIKAPFPPPIKDKYFSKLLEQEFMEKKLLYIYQDIQDTDFNAKLPDRADIIINFAGINSKQESNKTYNEVYIEGAKNICRYADAIHCTKLVYLSSTEVYGPQKKKITEESLCHPKSTLGRFSLSAEKIYCKWQQQKIENRLILCRSGFLFGPNDNGKISQMIDALKKHYFFYLSNKYTTKPCMYIQEFCCALAWLIKQPNQNKIIANMTTNNPPTEECFVLAISEILGISSYHPNLPIRYLNYLAKIINFILPLFCIAAPFNTKKLDRIIYSENVIPGYLKKHQYPFKHSLISAFNSWLSLKPEQFISKSTYKQN